jgi:hypothetical protein
MKKSIVTLVAGAVVAFSALPSSASLSLVETSTNTFGATTIIWESSFLDADYTLGDPILLTVNWQVVSGAATFNSLVQRGKIYTPTSKKDPALGTPLIVGAVANSGAAPSSGSVDAAFAFTALHFDEIRGVEIGNAHLTLRLNIDTDGDGATDSVIGFGVNVHVED